MTALDFKEKIMKDAEEYAEKYVYDLKDEETKYKTKMIIEQAWHISAVRTYEFLKDNKVE